MTGALQGIRILDLSRVLAGPWASQTLADLGAEVIKIERPGSGDDTRHWGPPFLTDPDGQPGDAAYFQSANRNKASVAIDFTQPEGRDLLRDLVQHSDVLLENFKVGDLARHGLDYASLRMLNPGLIYASITGFGQTGPYAARAGYDFMIQGLGGLMSLTGYPEGEPGAGPMKTGVAVTDLLTGLYAAIGILAALQHRTHSKVGQYLDLALLDVQVACLANQGMNYLIGGQPPARQGNAHPNIVPYQDFPAADGDFIIAVGNESQFQKLCALVGHPEWATDPRFCSNADRVANRTTLIALLRQITVFRRVDEWLELLGAAGIPCGSINNLAQVFADPQVQARGLALNLTRSDGICVPQLASPLRLSATPVSYNSAPASLGADTDRILSDILAVDTAQLKRLRAKGVIA